MDRKHTIEEILEVFQGIGHSFSHSFRSFSSEDGITYSQMLMLRIVKTNPGCGIKELSGVIGITSSAATQQVDSLVKKGYLVRKSNPDDRRSISLHLSADISRKADKLKAAFLEKLTTYFDALSDEELAEYARMNRKIADRISGK